MTPGWVLVLMKRLGAAALLLLGALYAGDYLWLRLRVSHPRAGPAFGAVQFYWATRVKNGSEEIFVDQPQTETCVRSLFPHLGCRPCWYSAGKTIRVVQ